MTLHLDALPLGIEEASRTSRQRTPEFAYLGAPIVPVTEETSMT